jgi:osmoprotectant transport system substrate-binding protein
LQTTYGLHFKDFKSLSIGSTIKSALTSGQIQVGLVFSSDADLNQFNLVVLDDDKHLQNADNVVPVLRQTIASDEVKRVLNAISAKLTTAELVNLNAQVELQHQDADVATRAWLEQHNWDS